jgi:hypothetical protein
MNLNFIFDDDFYHTLNSNHILKKYYILFNTFDYIIKHHSKYYSFLYNKRLGRKIKYPRSAFIKAFIYKHLENIKHTSQLINILRANPKLAIICGFKYNIPDDSLFYRFLKSTPSYIIDDIFNSIVQLLKQHNIISTDIVAIDSKPILAYTKYNNLKNPNRPLNKNNKPFTSKRNSEATLGYYSAGASSLNNNNQNSNNNSSKSKNKNKNKNNKILFFWGYRVHTITTSQGIPIAHCVVQNNIHDSIAGKSLIDNIKQKHNVNFILADAAFDNNDFYNYAFEQLNAIVISPKNKRNSDSDNNNSNFFSFTCPAGLQMNFDGFVREPHRVRLKFRCPIKTANKKQKQYLPSSCPINHPKFCSGKKYGCTKYFNPKSTLRNTIQNNTSLYKTHYKKRKYVEIYFSFLDACGIERPVHFYLNSIKNYTFIADIAHTLIALVSGVVLKKPENIRRYKHFAKGSPPIEELKFSSLAA